MGRSRKSIGARANRWPAARLMAAAAAEILGADCPAG